MPWSALQRDAPFNIGTALLLTDGSVFAQDDFTVNWWRLRPDSAGDYAHGNWTKAAPASRSRLYFASAVLADGRVFVAGGKYSDDAHNASNLLAAEIYDPVADKWTDLPVPDGWDVIGDAPCCVLPDRTVLLGDITTGECAIFDPARDHWRQTAAKRNGSASGESWVLLGDDSVLSIDCQGHPGTEQFAGGQWRAAPAIPAANDLVDPVSNKVGPALLRPDGTVFALGASGRSAIFSPTAPGWAAGPVLPASPAGVQYAAMDAPACLMPDGNVLFVAGEVTGTAASVLFEFDGATVTQMAAQPPNANVPPHATRLLLLPTGQALFTNSGPQAALSDLPNPPIPPNPAYQPTITQRPRQIAPGQCYLLRGLRLNGLSQACAYGDDASMATNYPLIRLIDTSAAATITYCRTYAHSTMAVATGAAEQDTNFQVPPGIALGEYEIELVANGIASARLPVTVIAAPPMPAAEPNPDKDTVFQREMFYRDLNEVHMLADYISGRADKSLADMNNVPNPDPDAPGNLTSQQALNLVGQIRFPPVGSREAQARQATLLLLVKDRLNQLALPARGISVAFTSMYAGVSLPDDDVERAEEQRQRSQVIAEGYARRRALAEPQRQPAQAIGDARRGEKPQPDGFAAAAYPNLRLQARTFRKYMSQLPYLTVLLALLTVVVSCDILVSSETIRNLIVSDKSCNIEKSQTGQLSIARTPSSDIAALCNILLAGEQAGDTSTGAVDLGRQGVESLFVDWPSYFHPIGWAVKIFGPLLPPRPKQPDEPPGAGAKQQQPETKPTAAASQVKSAATATPTGKAHHKRGRGKPPTTAQANSSPNSTPPSPEPPTNNQVNEDNEAAVAVFAATVVNMFSNAILPAMFGLLGTFAGIMRSVVTKVRDSTLNPRDVRLTWSLLPLGTIAGLSVGLIIAPDAATTSAAAGKVLSAASLSFLAGYGAENYFAMIDNLLTRVFPTTPPKP